MTPPDSQTLVIPVMTALAIVSPMLVLMLGAIRWFALRLFKDFTSQIEKLQTTTNAIIERMQNETVEAKLVGARVISHDGRLQAMEQRLLLLEQRPGQRGKR